MSWIGYVFFVGFAQFIGILPLRAVYIFSDFLYLLLRITGYRKSVIINNLKNSFPEKSMSEIESIKNKYLHFMADYILESIKCVTISKTEITKRVTIENIDLLERYKAENQNIIITAGHYGNWEMCGLAASIVCPIHLVGIYKPLTNVYIEKYMFHVRQKWGLEMVPMYDTAKIFENAPEQRATAFILVGDQSPSNPQKAYWTRFLNQDTAYHYGIEKYSKKYNLPIVFGKVVPEKRGYYRIILTEIIAQPTEYAANEITEICKDYLEKIIIENPVPWLWSHRRWKHKKPI